MTNFYGRNGFFALVVRATVGLLKNRVKIEKTGFLMADSNTAELKLGMSRETLGCFLALSA